MMSKSMEMVYLCENRSNDLIMFDIDVQNEWWRFTTYDS